MIEFCCIVCQPIALALGCCLYKNSNSYTYKKLVTLLEHGVKVVQPLLE